MGGYTVCDATLKRFYVLHMYLPFALIGLAAIHMYYLHSSGSNNPLGVDDGGDLVSFHPYYSHKDFVGILLMVRTFSGLPKITFRQTLIRPLSTSSPSDTSYLLTLFYVEFQIREGE